VEFFFSLDLFVGPSGRFNGDSSDMRSSDEEASGEGASGEGASGEEASGEEASDSCR
jgi:hypothetical protein